MDYEIKISNEAIDYLEAFKMMQNYKEQVLVGKKKSLFWLLQHNDIYTAGRGAKDQDLLDKTVETVQIDRGGQWTYHGEGQRIGYFVWDLKQFNDGILDVRKFVNIIENTIIGTLKYFGITATADRDMVGIWVQNGEKKEKIAAIGIKIGQMIATHGFALNVSTNLDKFKAIVPCGIKNYGVCSMESLGVIVEKQKVDEVLLQQFLLHLKKY
jgi:lipoyl(octanoyl) transferase